MHSISPLNSRSQGLTLIELLVSIAIAAILLTAASGLMFTSAGSRTTVKNLAEMREEAFFVSHTLKQQLAQVGFRGESTTVNRILPIASRDQAFPAATDWSRGQLIRVADNALHYRFNGASLSDGTADGSIYDCLGNAIPANSPQVATLSMTDNNLVCTVGTNSTTLIDGTSGTRVEQLAFSFGVDTNGDGEVDQMVNSVDATADDFMNSRHIVLRMLLATIDGVVRYNQTYRYDGGEISATDNRLRTEVVISVALRN